MASLSAPAAPRHHRAEHRTRRRNGRRRRREILPPIQRPLVAPQCGGQSRLACGAGSAAEADAHLCPPRPPKVRAVLGSGPVELSSFCSPFCYFWVNFFVLMSLVPICRSPVEMSSVCLESLMPMHSATASALMTSLLAAPACKGFGWLLEGNLPLSQCHDFV